MQITDLQQKAPVPASIVNRIREEDGCWVWHGARQPKGYGNVKYGGQHWRVHRLTYRILVGPIPDGLVLHHLCGNKSCCNPAHLAAVTQRTNVSLAWTDEAERLRLSLASLLDAVETAIRGGDWVVDGACDPDRAIFRARKALGLPTNDEAVYGNA